MDWLRESKNVATLSIYVQPGAKKTEVVGFFGDALKIRLLAPPVDGKANAALLQFIADRLGVAKSTIRLKSGLAARNKILEISSPPSDIRQRMLDEIKGTEVS